MATKSTSILKKLKAMKKDEMLSIPAEQIKDTLAVVSLLKFPVHRTYLRGCLIITRTV